MHKNDSDEKTTKVGKIHDEIQGTYMRKKIYFRLDDIVYITHYQTGSILHLCREKEKKYGEGKIIVPYNFQQLLELLDSADFSVSHNSYIVNMRYVSSISPTKEYFIADGRELPMSRGKKKKFLKDMIAYMARKREQDKLQTQDELDREYLLNFKYYVWLIGIYLKEKQYRKIREVLTELKIMLHMEETS